MLDSSRIGAAAFAVTSAKNVQVRTFRSPVIFVLMGIFCVNPCVDLSWRQAGLVVEYDSRKLSPAGVVLVRPTLSAH